MATDMVEAEEDFLQIGGEVERRLRNTFLGSTALSVLVVLHVAFLTGRGGPLSSIVHISYIPMLLWSFAVTGYAFTSLWRAARKRRKLLEHEARTDSRTGTNSFDFIRSFLDGEYKAALREGRSSAVLYVDLEKLDVVNRNFGHAIGDVVLKDVAGTIQKNLPEGAEMGRVAGDEFLVVMPGADEQEGRSVASKIEERICGYNMDLGKKGQLDFLGCRVGQVNCPGQGKSADEIIALASKAASNPDDALQSEIRDG